MCMMASLLPTFSVCKGTIMSEHVQQTGEVSFLVINVFTKKQEHLVLEPKH